MKLVSYIRKHTFFARILFSTILVLAVFTALSSVFYYRYMASSLSRMYQEKLEDSITLLNDELELYFRMLYSSAYTIGSDRDVSLKLSQYLRDPSDYTYIEFNSGITDRLDQLYITLDGIMDSAVYLANDSVFYNYSRPLRQDITAETYTALTDIDTSQFMTILEEQENPFFSSPDTVIPFVFSYRSSNFQTFLVIFISTTKLGSIFSDFYSSAFDGILISRSDGSCLFSNLPGEISLSPEDAGRSVRIGGKSYLVQHCQDEMFNFDIYPVIDSSEAFASILGMQKFQVLLFFLIVLLAGIILLFIYRSLMRPMNTLKDLMLENSEALTYRQAENTGEDEIGMLAQGYNQLIEEVESLVISLNEQLELLRQETEQKEWERKERRLAEIKALQAQINPHFLYNTLNAIVWTAVDNGDEETENLALRLAEFYRTTLSDGREFITVQEELRHAENYIWIQTRRYDRITYSFRTGEIPPGITVPKILLQPLIENSIYHGLKPKAAEGHIDISTAVNSDNQLEFRVRDNGTGIETGRLDYINGRLKEGVIDSSSGYGIYNINSRIKLIYGSSYGISLISEEGKMTEAVIILPLEERI